MVKTVVETNHSAKFKSIESNLQLHVTNILIFCFFFNGLQHQYLVILYLYIFFYV